MSRRTVIRERHLRNGCCTPSPYDSGWECSACRYIGRHRA